MSEVEEKVKSKLKARARAQEINNRRKKLDVAEEENVCMCSHKEKGQPNFAKGQRQGEWVCRNCHKPIKVSFKPTEEEIDKAIALLDNMCDIVKLTLDEKNEADQDILKKVAKFQFRTRNFIKKVYLASLKKNQKKGNNNSNGGASSSWKAPTTR